MLLIFVILLILAAGVRLLTFDRFLPYFDYHDEPIVYMVEQHWRGAQDQLWIAERYSAYPPAYMWIYIPLLNIYEALSGRTWFLANHHIYVARLLSVLIGTITAAVIASIAWQLAGPLAGSAAGLIWALSPRIVENNSLALPDPFVYLVCAAAITLAVRGWQKQSVPWMVGSWAMGIAAVYLKYWPIHALIPWGMVMLALTWKQPRRLLPWLIIQVVLGLAAAAYLVFIYGALSQPAIEIQTFNASGMSLMFDPARNLANWSFAIEPIGTLPFFAMLAAAIPAYLYSRQNQWRTIPPGWSAVLLLYSIAGILFVSSFMVINLDFIRHVLPSTIALIVLWTLGLTQIVWTLQDWGRIRQPGRFPKLVPWGAALVTGMVVLPFLVGDAEIVHRYSLPTTRYLLWHWADVNVPAEGMILMHPESEIEDNWNRPWSGYDGVQSFTWWFERNLTEDRLAEYIERGMTYFAMSEPDRQNLFNTPEMEAFIDQLTLLKVIHESPDAIGHTLYFYRLAPPQHAVQYTFGGQISLVGYDLDAESISPGDTVRFRPYWRTVRQPDTNYSMFVHLYPQDRIEIVAQQDGPPTNSERLTLTWDDTEELYIGQTLELVIGDDVQPGDYRLAVGLYAFATGERLTGQDGSYFFEIPITITPRL